ncbi:MAG: TetR/AcrR family transcriptional regulator [Catenulispora sp.]
MPDIKHFDPDAVLDSVVHLFWRNGTAATGIQDVVEATGLNRSSLYNAFGGKDDLYIAALHRYVDRYSRPALERLSGDGRGLDALREFFDGLIDTRCHGEYARWGCMVANAHAGAGAESQPDVAGILLDHHRRLVTSLRSALTAAGERGQLRADADPDACANHLALVAYGVNIRSRSGALADELRRGTEAALASIAFP